VSTSYKVKVNDTYNFDVDATQLSELDAVQNSETEFHILNEHTSYKAIIVNADFNQKKYTISINNNNYTVAIADELDVLIKEMGFSLGNAKKVNEIKAPMPGLVLEVNVEAGQTIQKGDPLLILEAMKMENVIKSAGDGVVEEILIEKGAAVEKGALLIKLA